MDINELKRKYGIHEIKEKDPNIKIGKTRVEGVECRHEYSIWSDGLICYDGTFSVKGATWTVVQDLYAGKWFAPRVTVTLYTKMTEPKLIDIMLQQRKPGYNYSGKRKEAWYTLLDTCRNQRTEKENKPQMV